MCSQPLEEFIDVFSGQLLESWHDVTRHELRSIIGQSVKRGKKEPCQGEPQPNCPGPRDLWYNVLTFNWMFCVLTAAKPSYGLAVFVSGE